MTRADRIVVAVVVAAAMLSWPASLLANGSLGSSTTVTIAGPTTTYSVPLSTERVIDVPGLKGMVTVRIHGGAVAISDSDCPDQLCKRQGAVSSGAIICAPNGVTVSVGGGASDLDAHIR